MLTRREALVAGTGLAAGMALGVPRALAGRAGRAGRSPETFFPWKEIAAGVHAVVDPDTGGNTLLAVGTDRALLVDTKFPGVGKALLREAEAMGVRLAYAVNTHHHGDHTGGNFAFIAAGIEVVAHKKAEPRVLANWDQYRGQAAGGVRFVGGLDRPTREAVLEEAGDLSTRLSHMDASDWSPTRLMNADRETLGFGGRTAELTHFGASAHTDNDTLVFLPDANVLHTGDLVFSGLHPYFDPAGGSTAPGWIDALGKARALCDDKTVVVPGHGPIGGAAVIDRQRDYLQRLVEAVRKEIDAGTTREDAVQKRWEFMDGLGFEQVRPRAIGAVYDELAGE